MVGILGGIEHLRDGGESANPIATDATVVEAWAQDIFSHYSQVSRTLQAADEQTYEDVLDVLRSISAPYIQQAITETLVSQERLTIDLDLTGRTVSPNSEDYPDAEFGWMNDKVAKGYQAAITSLVCERWGRLILTLLRLPGRTLSAECVQDAVRSIEELLQVRPYRRTRLVIGRRDCLLTQIDRNYQQQKANREQINHLWQDLSLCEDQIKSTTGIVATLEARYQSQGLEARPHSKLAKARHKLVQTCKRKLRLEKKMAKIERAMRKIEYKISCAEEQLILIDQWLANLEADNSSNPNPVKII